MGFMDMGNMQLLLHVQPCQAGTGSWKVLGLYQAAVGKKCSQDVELFETRDISA